MFIRITKRIFKDLAIYMISLGILVGIAFPFFILLFGVPKSIAFQPVFFCACIAAGILLATMNIGLARNVVGKRIRVLSGQMKHVEGILAKRMAQEQYEKCTPDTCYIKVDSEDELGDSAKSFNQLIQTLSEVMEAQTDLQKFSEMLTSHLELDVLANETLHHLLMATHASGGAILSERNGELSVVSSYAVDQEKSLPVNSILCYTMEKHARQIISFPEDIVLEGVLTQYRPKELIIEPIIYKQVLIGVIILAGVEPFSRNELDRLSAYGPILSMAFNNAITHLQMQQTGGLGCSDGHIQPQVRLQSYSRRIQPRSFGQAHRCP